MIRNHDTADINTRLPDSLNRIRGILPPLGLAYIASSLERANHEIKIVDAQIENLNLSDIQNTIKNFNPVLIGITTMTSNFRGALEVAKLAKDNNKITLVGGPNLEVFPEETLSYDSIDFGILGEGDVSIVKFVEALENKSSFENIPGLAYKKDNKIIVNPPELIQNIDELPFPARHLLPINKYSSLISQDPMTTMITSRGCPYKCSFCFKQHADTKARFRDPISVVDEIESLVINNRIKEVMFYDDTIVTKRTHIEGICRELIKRKLKIRWESPSRVNSIDLDLLKLMKQSGCIRLRYGVESGDESILKEMNKQITGDQVKNIFKLTRSVGIESFAYFMTGYLNESRKMFENTMKLIKEISADQIMITLTTPYPKTALEKNAIKLNMMPEDYWKDFILGKINYPLPPLVKGSEKWIKEAYRSFYFRPTYICGRLRHIKTFNQLKKHIQAAMALLVFKVRNN
ncbi:MAG: cobalamin-dependent protein [Oligoflexia bacterium]|nr:cobalamin-dependent protein [Oligoflexia bacterium]